MCLKKKLWSINLYQFSLIFLYSVINYHNLLFIYFCYFFIEAVYWPETWQTLSKRMILFLIQNTSPLSWWWFLSKYCFVLFLCFFFFIFLLSEVQILEYTNEKNLCVSFINLLSMVYNVFRTILLTKYI